MQTLIVILIIIFSAGYLINLAIKSLRQKTKGSCSSCGKE